MGGKSGSSNDAVVNEQKKQAAEARQKEAERQARLKQGMGSIKGAFEGSPVMGNRNVAFDWSTFKPPTAANAFTGAAADPGSVPAGFTAVQVDDPKAKGIGGIQRPGKRVLTNIGSLKAVGNPAGKDYWSYEAPTTSTQRAAPAAKVWALKGADGKIYYQGDKFNYDQSYDTGQRTGGFDDAYYNKYKQGVLDYYQPQVDKQYEDAKKELTYRLARAGTLRSSAANTETADLSNQYDLNTGQVLNKADTAAADLRSQVASERAKAESQLYATEDPDAAQTQAVSAVRNISLEQPNLSPLSMLFNLATVGGANILKGYQNQNLANQFAGGSGGNAGRLIQ